MANKVRTIQNKKVLDYLRVFGSITQKDALFLGVYRLSARVYDLRNDYNICIETVNETAKNADGIPVTYARYYLRSDEYPFTDFEGNEQED